MAFALFVALMLLHFNDANAVCNDVNVTATTSRKFLSHNAYSNDEDCSFYIAPQFPSGYFLQIEWYLFDVEGSMPSCFDYVEVSLTRSYSSIGKYCSENLYGLPFNMYSHDGYAKITFHSDNNITMSGFQLTYQLKNKTSEHLGTKSKRCGVQRNGVNSYNFFSAGWPDGFLVNPGSAGYHCFIYESIGLTDRLVIAVMDSNLSQRSQNCSISNNYLQIKGSNSIYNDPFYIQTKTYAISRKYCGAIQPTYIDTAAYPFIYMYHIRTTSARFPGFVVGFMAYRSSKGSKIPRTTKTPSTTKASTSNTSEMKLSKQTIFIIGGSVGGGILIMVLVIIVCCRAKKRTRPADSGIGMNTFDQQQSAPAVTDAR